MNTPSQEPARPYGRTPGFKFFMIMGLAILMCLPLFMISLAVAERQVRAGEATADIESSWGRAQNIAGILLFVPYEASASETFGAGTISTLRRNTGVLLPARAQYSAAVRTETRSRGIYDVTVYTTDLTIVADFDQSDIAELAPAGATVLWNEAVAVVGLTDVRGLQQNPTLSVGGMNVPFLPGPGPSAPDAKFASIHAPLSLVSAPDGLALQTTLTLRGSSELAFAPVGKDTVARVQSAWPHPSFFGAFLPDQRQVGPTGFDVSWNVPYLARGFGQVFAGATALTTISETQFGVRFYRPIDFYQLVARSLKYAVLFVGLAFLSFFVVELLTGARLHAAQYALIGAAQVLFYLLLLSIAEHLGFETAYAIGATATVGLTTAYAVSAFGSRRHAGILLVVLSVQYAALYSLLQVEDYALLLGSVLLFAVLAVVMYLTRNLNWYRLAPLPGEA